MSAEAKAEPDSPTGPLRRTARIVIWGVAGFLALLVAGVGVLQIDSVSTSVARSVALRFVPDSLELTVGSVSGSWLGSLRVVDLELRSRSGETVVRVDTIFADYALTPLLGREVRLDELRAVGVATHLVRRPGGRIGLPGMTPAPIAAPPDSTTDPWTIRIAALEIRNAEGRLRSLESDSVGRNSVPSDSLPRDSTVESARESGAELTWSGVQVALSDVQAGSALRLRLDSLSGELDVAGDSTLSAIGPLQVRARGALDHGALRVDTLDVTGPGARLAGSGELALPDSSSASDSLRFHLQGFGLPLAPVHVFLGNAPDPGARFDVEVDLTGTGRYPAADVDLRTTAGGRVSGHLRTDEADDTEGRSGTRYRADLELSSLDPSTFTGDTALAGEVGGGVTLDLAGPSPDRFGGSLDARLDPLTVSGLPLRSARLESIWTDGEARLDLRVLGEGIRAELSGTARPLDSIPAYDLSGPVEATIPGDSVARGRAEGSVSLRGRGTAPATASARVELRLSVLEVGRARADSAYLEAALDSGRAVVRIRAGDGGTGVLRANADASVTAPFTFELRDMVAENLDVAAMLGDSVPSRLDARLHGRGRLDSTDELEFEIDGRMDGRFGPVQLDTAILDGSLREGRLAGSVRLLSSAGRLSMDLEGRPLDSVPTLQIHHLTFDSLQLAALTADTSGTLSTRLSGTGEGHVRGFSPKAMEVAAELTLDSSRVGNQSLSGGSGKVEMSVGRMTVSLDLAEADSGGVRLRASARPFEARPEVDVDTLALRGVHVGAWFPTLVPGWLGPLTGAASGRVAGRDLASMVGEVTVRLDSTTLAGRPVRQGGLEARIAEGRLTAESRLSQAGAQATLHATASLADSVPSYTLTARVQTDSTNSPGAAPSAHGDVVLTIEGKGITLETADARVAMHGDSVRLGSLRLDTLRLEGQIRNGLASLDTLHVRSNVVRMTGGGSVGLLSGAGAHNADLRLQGEVQSLTPLESMVGIRPLRLGTGEFSLEVAGPPDSLLVNATAKATALLLGTTEVVGLDSHVQGRMSVAGGLGPVSGGLELDRLSVGGVDVRLSSLTGRWDGDEITLAGDATVDERRDVTFQVAITPTANAARASFDQLDVRVDDDQWRLVGTPSVSWAHGIRIDSLDVRAPDQSLLIDGLFDPAGGSDLHVELDRLRIGGLADLAGVERVSGTLSGHLQLEGSAADPRFTLGVKADLEDPDGRRSNVDATVEYDSLRLAVDGDVELEEGGRLVAKGGIPVDLSLSARAEGDTTSLAAAAPGRADLRIQADSFQVAWAESFLDPTTIRGVEGRLDMDLTIGGTQSAPALSGDARLSGGRLTLPALGTTWKDVGARVSLGGDLVRVDSALARSGDGEARLSGTLALHELSLGEFNIEAHLHRFQAMDNDAFHVRVSGTTTMVGTTEKPRLKGDLELVETDVDLDNAMPSANASVRSVVLSEDDIRALEEYLGIPVKTAASGATPLFDALAIDVSVSASRDTWIRQRTNPKLELQLSGNVKVTREPGDSMRLDGQVETVAGHSYLEQFGRRFSVDRGDLDFRGTIPQTQVDVRAVYRVPSKNNPDAPEATITLDVGGALDSLSVTLGSEPTMENADIVAYLATGRPASTSLAVGSGGSGGGGGLESVGSNYALGQVTGLVEGLAADKIGLDVVEIEADGLKGATLIAGRFVSPKVYVGFRQPVGRDARATDGSGNVDRTQVEIEYQALRWLLMNMDASQSTIGFFLNVRHAY